MPIHLEFGFFILCIIMSSIEIPLFATLKNTRGDANDVKYSSIIVLILAPCLSLSIYLQNGFYEAACIIFIIHQSSVFIISTSLLSMVTRPLINGVMDSHEGLPMVTTFFLRLRMIKIFGITSLTICGFIQLAFCRDINPSRYNAVLVTSLFVLFTMYFFVVVIGLLTASVLERILKTNMTNVGTAMPESQAKKHKQVLKKINMLKGTVYLFFITVDLPYLIMGIIFCVTGSFPFFGLVIVGTFVSGYINFFWMTITMSPSSQIQRRLTVLQSPFRRFFTNKNSTSIMGDEESPVAGHHHHHHPTKKNIVVAVASS
jgi:hypothetical protein